MARPAGRRAVHSIRRKQIVYKALQTQRAISSGLARDVFACARGKGDAAIT